MPHQLFYILSAIIVQFTGDGFASNSAENHGNAGNGLSSNSAGFHGNTGNGLSSHSAGSGRNASSSSVGIAECVGVGQCFCNMENGQKTDLTALGEYIRDYAAGGVITAEDPNFSGTTYSLNPCEPFECETGSQNALVCVKANGVSQIIGAKIASQSPIFDSTGDILIEGIIAQTQGIPQVSSLACHCDKNALGLPKLKAVGKIQGVYSFEITHTCCCPDGCTGFAPGLSGGSVLLIVFFVLLGVYLVVGVGLQKLRNGATGSDVIPNKELWLNCASLVKDGGNFVVAKVTGKRTEYENMT